MGILKENNHKKKILVIGSIADFGGREVEVKNIMDALSEGFDVRLFSTVPMTKKSMAIKDNLIQWTSIHNELYNSNIFLKGFSLLNKKWNNSDQPTYLLVSNKISSFFFNFNKRNIRILKRQIDSVQAILFCGVLTNGFLTDSIDYCLASKKPFILRTTGTIKDIPLNLKYLLPKIESILVHSYSNTSIFSTSNFKNIKIVDQTTLQETELLKIPIEIEQELVFGYLGRFSKEKGIIELLEIFKKNNLKIIVAGSGNLELDVLDLINDKNDFIGEVSPDDLEFFFNKIDVLIIPSHEEAGPLVGIEAMAAGKIIFSTEVGAMKERLSGTENNFWFDINKEQSFLQLLQRLKNIEPEEIKVIRETNRKIYLENYSIEKISNKYLNMFDELIC
jgi:glycosyltransferase involved in cell wall biosynthesis